VTVRLTDIRTIEVNLSDWLVRGCTLDDRTHFYRKSELADPAYENLVPMCGQDPMYPARHPRVEAPRNFLASHGFCPTCAAIYDYAATIRGIPRSRQARP
jgi:hypothetical protein